MPVVLAGVLIGSIVWLNRSVSVTRAEVVGVWESSGTGPKTKIVFGEDGTAEIFGGPLPPTGLQGDVQWTILQSGTETRILLTDSAEGGHLYAEPLGFSTVLVSYLGDPDQPGMRFVLSRVDNGG
ncbi:hypothetical protein P5G50_05475 [Leifsonia sp. F6_8S_P_1B]|uniref:TIGR03067 domain-containing protein n=1 Tax=Leifsonia williamsii TaxID=3035919 RepID=A0ABT8K8W0_9MICO|nr:hypothetical protein [Leifsonia williamsii]MDN4613899.1 hypothetical protein [Leifsonia williamsii]